MEIVLAIISKVGEYLVEPAINQVRYLLCFKSIIQDLEGAETKLELEQVRIKQKVEIAKDNTQTVEKVVEKWLIDASNTLAEVQQLKDEIQSNRTCFRGWCPNWGWRYRLNKKAVKKTNMMLELQEYPGKFDGVAHPTALPGIEFSAPKDFELFRSSKSAFDSIIEALKNDKIDVVGLFGMGGAGKTTLAKVVGNKVKEDKIFDEAVMVVVSQTPNFINIQSQLAAHLSLERLEPGEDERAKRLYLRFTGTKKKILVILDDVWEKFELKSKLGIPFGRENKGCKILITTRKQNVCTAMGCQSRIPLDLLDEGEGLALLKRHAGIDIDSLTLNALVIEVARECKGLPLALVTVGCALKEKGVDEWKLVSQKLKKSKLVDINNVLDVDVDVYACLKLSYDYLKDKETKLCFLMCSLFPEEYEIPLENLFRYGMGLGLYPDDVSFEEARSQFHVMVNSLKASCLLLDCGEEDCVKMHDMVRDVALWIASQGENVFMVKAGMGLTKWPKVESLENCTAISLMANDIKELPDSLFCPSLGIFLVKGAGSGAEVPEEFFKEMKGLKVLNLSYCDLSLRSLRFLTSLKTLELIHCNLRDISSLGKLNRLEILNFKYSYFDELPRELGELSKLRLLDLDNCKLERITSNVIQRCSQLEELYIIGSYTKWEVDETSEERSNVSLLKPNSLSCLVRLHLEIYTTYLPKDFALPNLERYVICVNTYYDEPYVRALEISEIETTSPVPFQALYHNIEYVSLRYIGGVQEVFQFEGLCYTGDEKHAVLPSLTKLVLEGLPQLICIWKGPTQFLILQSLKYLKIDLCMKVEYIFPISIARSLVKLEELYIQNASQIKQVFYNMDDGRKEHSVPGDRKDDIVLPKLKKLKLDELENLISFYPENYHSTWPALEELEICNCSNLGISFIAEVNMQDLGETLRVLKVAGCKQQLSDGILGCLSGYEFKNLEEISLVDCGVKVVFDLEGGNEQQRQLSLPSLKKLSLIAIEELEHLCKGPTHLLSLQNLTILRLCNCGQVRYIFTPSLAQNLSKLDTLYVRDCGELEKIIVEDDEEDDDIQPHLLFPNLRQIDVQRCKKLKRVFPITIARGLQQLKELRLWGSIELEQVFGEKERDRDEGGEVMEMEDKAIVLPQLQILSLWDLQRLTSFCPVGYHFIFPSFMNGRLIVKGCGKIATRFSWDENNSSVHGEAQPPKEGSNDDDEEHSMDVRCYGSYELRASLPPYMEQMTTEEISPSRSRRET